MLSARQPDETQQVVDYNLLSSWEVGYIYVAFQLVSDKVMLITKRKEGDAVEIWDPYTQTCISVTPISLVAGTHLFAPENYATVCPLFLPEGPVLSKLEDEIQDLSNAEKFLYRALAADEKFHENLEVLSAPDRGDKPLPQLLKHQCVDLGDGHFGILKKQILEAETLMGYMREEKVYLRIFQQEQKEESYHTQFKQLLELQDCQYSDANRMIYAVGDNQVSVWTQLPNRDYHFYKVNQDQKSFVLEKTKQLSFKNTTQYFFPFPKNNEIVHVDGDALAITKTNLSEQSAEITYAPRFYKESEKIDVMYPVRDHFLIAHMRHANLRSHTYIYDLHNGTLQLLNFPFHIKNVMLLSSGHVLLQRPSGFVLVEFPKLKQWFISVQKRLDAIMQIFPDDGISPVFSIVRNYVGNDWDRKPGILLGSFFNTSFTIFSQEVPANSLSILPVIKESAKPRI